ncbi:asparaginyl/glutamyl-tRNA amidotransferase subunit C [Candidatus Berkelbacteria bacterium RBG_13_40_8]|uniref:Aspartyl/glutamyl-tRNA(Asn/Gln) amidotransferase subunit C n=1 Tax=Candidatus Berkelbacteria bacterium RBG_13_40_8 TaxID=1797467 RepID=A0A1F5DMB1_9BACT|nr:MAG: asparaginyl/glutamyl-tRNA amidotransferase subunit C [Candidatus Berkelbacteria bacterium RBG_13_40_8]
MAISKEDVEHVAKLARIKISEEEKKKFTEDLGKILNYVEELESAPTEGVIPVAQISGLDNIAREDEITESLPNEKVLQNAPEKQDNFIRVKKVFE